FYEHLIGSTQENQIFHPVDNKKDLRINITNLIVRFDGIKQFLDLLQLDNQQKSQLIIELNNQIEYMWQSIDEQQSEIEYLKKKLQRLMNIAEI
ncbi:37087_t:CDS:1, partial [Gigaspora margarita]